MKRINPSEQEINKLLATTMMPTESDNNCHYVPYGSHPQMAPFMLPYFPPYFDGQPPTLMTPPSGFKFPWCCHYQPLMQTAMMPPFYNGTPYPITCPPPVVMLMPSDYYHQPVSSIAHPTASVSTVHSIVPKDAASMATPVTPQLPQPPAATTIVPSIAPKSGESSVSRAGLNSSKVSEAMEEQHLLQFAQQHMCAFLELQPPASLLSLEDFVLSVREQLVSRRKTNVCASPITINISGREVNLFFFFVKEIGRRFKTLTIYLAQEEFCRYNVYRVTKPSTVANNEFIFL